MRELCALISLRKDWQAYQRILSWLTTKSWRFTLAGTNWLKK